MKESILDVVHSAAKGMHKAGVIDKVTMREYDALCLPPITKFSASRIKKLRQKARVSQALFAKLLNTSLSTVQQWEQGDKNPSGISLKLLHIIDDYGVEVLLPRNQG